MSTWKIEIDALLAYLNSPVPDDNRHAPRADVHTAMDKIGPNGLEGEPVLDPRELDCDTVSRLAGLFEELYAASRDGGEEAVLEEISDAIDDVVDL